MATCLELYGYDDARDTGFCMHCNEKFTDDERTSAVHGMVRHGLHELYAHASCWTAWYNRPVKVTISWPKED